MRKLTTALLLLCMGISSVSAYDYGNGKYVDDKTKQSIDASVSKLTNDRVQTVRTKVDTLLAKRKFSKKNRELLEYLSYSLQAKISESVVVSAPNTGKQKPSTIKTVAELKKLVGKYIEFRDDGTFLDSDGVAKKVSFPSGQGGTVIFIKTPNNIDWQGYGDDKIDFGKNILMKAIGEFYLISTNGYIITDLAGNPSVDGNQSGNNTVIKPYVAQVPTQSSFYPEIMTVDELKGQVKEFVKTDDQLSFYDKNFDRWSIVPLGGRGFLRIDNPNSIDWKKQWTAVDNGTLGQNILVKVGGHNTYFLSLGGYKVVNRYLEEGMTQAEYDTTKKDLQETVANLVSGKTTEEEKIGVIYDWITSNIKYNRKYFQALYNPDGSFNPKGYEIIAGWPLEDRVVAYPVLVYKYKKAVCYGYAQLFWLMLKMAGIQDVVEIGGTINGSGHEWNRVNGYYYDPTNESAGKRYRYKMLESDLAKSGLRITTGVTTADE